LFTHRHHRDLHSFTLHHHDLSSLIILHSLSSSPNARINSSFTLIFTKTFFFQRILMKQTRHKTPHPKQQKRNPVAAPTHHPEVPLSNQTEKTDRSKPQPLFIQHSAPTERLKLDWKPLPPQTISWIPTPLVKKTRCNLLSSLIPIPREKFNFFNYIINIVPLIFENSRIPFPPNNLYCGMPNQQIPSL